MALEAKERLDLADDFTAGAVRIEDLIEKGEEGAAQALDAIAAVGAFLGLGKKARRQPGANELFQVGQALLAEVLDPFAQGGQAGAKRGEERSMHMHSINTVLIDSQHKMLSMKNRSPSLAALDQQYDRLRKSLAQIGYISQGTVLARSGGYFGPKRIPVDSKGRSKNHHCFVKSPTVRGHEGGRPKRAKTMEDDPADGEGFPPNPLCISTRYAPA